MSDSSGPAVNLNLNVRGLKPSATVAINEHSNALLRQGKTVYKLGLGQSPFPVPASVVAALQENAFQKDYLPVRGLWELRKAVAEYHHRVDHVEISPEHILVGPGSKELLFLTQLAFYGDLLVPAPCWVSYAPQARIIGRQVHFIPTTGEEGWRLKPERLAKICKADTSRPRVLILNYPGNPDGNTYGEEELEQLAEVARKHKVVLLSDEIYGPLYHDTPHRSIATFYPEGTIISNGISKWCGAGGWRLGTFAFPPQLRWLLDAMASLASETFTSTSAPIQWASIRAFQGGPDIDEYLRHCRRILKALGLFCARSLREAGASCDDPRGAFYLFPDFAPLREKLASQGIDGATSLCREALEQAGTAFLPGDEFGMPEDTLTARLAYVDFDGAAAIEASSKHEGDLDDAWLAKHCGSVYQGINRLCEWLDG